MTLETCHLDLLGEPHGFGGFLFGADGCIVVEDGHVWLYTTSETARGWESWVRPLRLSNLKGGEKRRVLMPRPSEDRAVLHHVFAAAPGLIVGLYCDGLGVSAAIADAPDGEFIADPDFCLRPEEGWETLGQGPEGWTLESNGAYVAIERSDARLSFWQGYDSYRRDGRKGDLGWVRLEVDLVRRRVLDRGRHPRNPLPFRPDGWACARCGGNLSAEIRISGRRPYFFYRRPDPDRLNIALALSRDPLFFDDVEFLDLGPAIGDEVVAEKFQAVARESGMDLFYESKATDGTWRTAVRRYRMSTSS